MEKILLDTNIFIYLEDGVLLDKKISELTKMLYNSSEYKIVIHPKTKEETLKIKDLAKNLIFNTKLSIYKEIISPPVPSKEFHKIVGCNKKNDLIDNYLLYAIKQNSADYLITADKKIKKKSLIIGLESKILTIDEALIKFRVKEEQETKKPIFIENKYLYEIDINDNFFDSLKSDYSKFADWFIKKQKNESKAYITKNAEGKIQSFLMLKIEDEKEKYDSLEHQFAPAKRLKISTLKVADTGKKIGEAYLKIIVDNALECEADEIYVTVFAHQKYLIEMMHEYGFERFTYIKSLLKVKEEVWVKNMCGNQNSYPFVNVSNNKIFIVPIKQRFHEILFPEAETKIQLGFDDYTGLSTASNSIKKAYITNSNTKKIIPGSILLFYSSGDKKAITSLGVVEAVFNDISDVLELKKLVNKRTAYKDLELAEQYKKNSLVIMFKHYLSFPRPAKFSYLLNNKIVKGSIQCITEISREGFDKIVKECKIDEGFIKN